VNVLEKQIEVYRRPIPDTSQPFQYGYAERTIFHLEDSIQPLSAEQSVKVADLLQ
jgi:hypothetical protein